VTDREKIENAIDIQACEYDDKDYSLTIKRSGIKIMFTRAGEIKSIIRDGMSYGPLRQVKL
jgi:hypothetical protein